MLRQISASLPTKLQFFSSTQSLYKKKDKIEKKKINDARRAMKDHKTAHFYYIFFGLSYIAFASSKILYSSHLQVKGHL